MIRLSNTYILVFIFNTRIIANSWNWIGYEFIIIDHDRSKFFPNLNKCSKHLLLKKKKERNKQTSRHSNRNLNYGIIFVITVTLERSDTWRYFKGGRGTKSKWCRGNRRKSRRASPNERANETNGKSRPASQPASCRGVAVGESWWWRALSSYQAFINRSAPKSRGAAGLEMFVRIAK